MVPEDEIMIDAFIPIGSVREWLGSLSQNEKDVVVPVEIEGKVCYENLDEVGEKEILIDFQNSRRPLKDIVFPQTEMILRYKRKVEGDLEVEELRPQMKDTVVFGIRPCDAMAINILDSVFSGVDPDPYYWERRNKVVLVGIGCTDPHFNCFCTTVGGNPHGVEGLDMLLTKVDDGLYAVALTKKGETLITEGPFQKAERSHRDKAKAVHEGSIERIARTVKSGPLGPTEMVSALDRIFDDELWSDTSKKCIGCGACTYLCPTCHCFDINDEGTQKKGRRVRNWDTCQFPEFTLHTSGHNPRPLKKNRIRQRVYHKFKYMPENLGTFGCVGCGRCITYCPVNMDIFRIILNAKEVAQ